MGCVSEVGVRGEGLGEGWEGWEVSVRWDVVGWILLEGLIDVCDGLYEECVSRLVLYKFKSIVYYSIYYSYMYIPLWLGGNPRFKQPNS